MIWARTSMRNQTADPNHLKACKDDCISRKTLCRAFITPFPLLNHYSRMMVILEPSEDGGFTVYAPGLPGCISECDTREEALADMREAIDLYLEPEEDDLSHAHAPNAEMAEIAV